MTNKVLGGGALDGSLGLNPDFSTLTIPLGRVVQSVDNEGYIQYWIIEETLKAGGNTLANGLYANSTTLKEVAGGVSKLSVQNRQAIEAAYKAQGYNNVFFFEDGFTYTEANDIAISNDGVAWTYADADALPVTVAAGTVPSEGVYDPVKVTLPPFDTIEEMVGATYLSTLPEDTSVVWDGYYTKGDGGGNSGLLKFGAHTSDGGSVFSVDANTYIKANLKGKKINVRKFGAVGDFDLDTKTGTDDSDAFISAIAYARGLAAVIYAPASTYLINKRLFFGPLNEAAINQQPVGRRGICAGLVGDSMTGTRLYCGDGLNNDIVIDMTGMREKTLKDFAIYSESSTDAPLIGILTARFVVGASGQTNNDYGTFNKVSVTRAFKYACAVSVATEEHNVKNCEFYCDEKYNGAMGAYVATNDIDQLGVNITEASETSMLFARGLQSSLHQYHDGCSYYFGANSPTRTDAAMILSRGVQMFKVKDGFFNNNAHNFDCMRVERGIHEPFVFGIQLENADIHQTVRTGINLVDANVRCSMTGSNNTLAFSVGAVEVNGFTNNFTGEQVGGDLVVNNPVANSVFDGVRNLIWKSQHAIQNTTVSSTIASGGLVIDYTTPSSANSLTYKSQDENMTIVGLPALPTLKVTSEIIKSSNNGASALKVSTGDYGSFNNTLVEIDCSAGSPLSFHYLTASRQGVDEVAISRGGHIVCNRDTGGVWLTSLNGTKYRLRVNDAGDLTTAAGTPPSAT